MPASTPKYALPYPVGSDPVADGDNAIKSLAEQVEAVMSTGRYWTGTRQTTNPFAAGAWLPLVPLSGALTLTGLPVGGIALVQGVLILKSTGDGSNVAARINGTGATLTPALDQAQATADVVLNRWVSLPCFRIVTATAANPTVWVEGVGNAGTLTVELSSHIIATRLA